jgi:hypothetical protein
MQQFHVPSAIGIFLSDYYIASNGVFEDTINFTLARITKTHPLPPLLRREGEYLLPFSLGREGVWGMSCFVLLASSIYILVIWSLVF